MNFEYFSLHNVLHDNIKIGTEDLHEKTENIPEQHCQSSSQEHRHLQDTDLWPGVAGNCVNANPDLSQHGGCQSYQQDGHPRHPQPCQHRLQYFPLDIPLSQSGGHRVSEVQDEELQDTPSTDESLQEESESRQQA